MLGLHIGGRSSDIQVITLYTGFLCVVVCVFVCLSDRQRESEREWDFFRSHDLWELKV